MMIVGFTCRYHDFEERSEIALCFDIRWNDLIDKIGAIGIPLPTATAALNTLLANVPFSGFILTGGGDPACISGAFGERDASERAIVAYASRNEIPVIGVCRGMQMLLGMNGGTFNKCAGHVASTHEVRFANGDARIVNSYHNYSVSSGGNMRAIAHACDGSIEAVEYAKLNQYGIMWHPERKCSFDPHDITLFREWLGLTPFQYKRI